MDVLNFVICLILFAFSATADDTEDKCPMPAIPDNSTLVGPVQPTFPIGHIAQIIGGCGPGTYFNQTCMPNATWTMPTSCKEMAWCNQPQVKPHTMIVNPREEYNFNASITIACDNGYINGGPDTIYCQSNGSWSPEIPDCIKNECPENCMAGQICNETDHACPYGKCDSAYWGRFCQHPSECRTTSKGKEYRGYKNVTVSGKPCQMWKLDIPHDHKYKDLPENYCRNPDGEPEPWCYTTDEDVRWEICSVPFCHAQCPPPPLSINTDVINIPEDGFPLGYKVLISGTRCGKGNVGSKVCEVNKYRRWSAALCIPVECEIPPLHKHSYITDKKDPYVYGDIITVACHPGYRLSVNKVYRCQENATWNGTMPRCHVVTCARPSLKPHLHADIQGNSSFVAGQSVNVSCAEGYVLPDRGVITCQSDDSWGNIPECSIVNCSKSDIHGKYTAINKEKTTYSVNDTVILSCPVGYTLEGNRVMTCLANGHWNGTAPSCKDISCIVPTLSAHHVIQAEGKQNLTVNGTINIDCVLGYSPVGGAQSLQCLENGTWEGSVPTCEEVNCAEPNLQNADIKGTKSQYRYMDVISVTCQEGYTPTGVYSYECQQSGIWNGTMPFCSRVWCSNPVLDQLAILELPIKQQEKYEYKSKIRINCIPGYTLLGGNTFHCQRNGYWNGTMPKCIATNCEIPKLTENATISIQGKHDLMPGGNIEIGCKEGFIARGETLLKCLPNSTWSHLPPICEVTTCKNPVSNTGNLQVTPDKEVFVYNQRIVVSCSSGYNIQGQNIFKCEQNGDWNGTMPHCKAIKCVAPTLRSNSFFANPKVENYLFGDLIQVLCPPNFLLIGPAVLQCRDNGAWNGTMPFCEAISCRPPLLSKEKYVIISDKKDLEVGGSIFVKCADGLRHTGDNMLTCLQNGTWDKNVPSCDVVECEHPSIDDSTFIRNPKENYIYSDVIQIFCKEETTILQGQNKLMCTKNGIWNGSMPSCKDVTCSLPPLSRHNVIIGRNMTSLVSGTDISIGCRTGYLPTSFSTLTCNALGIWDGNVPQCEIARCADPRLPNGTFIAIGRRKSYTFGDILTIACDKTFKRTAHTSVACDHDKVWVGNFPVCEEVTCDPPRLQSTVRVTFDSTKAFRVGGIIHVQCQYDKEPGIYLECLESGTWNDSLPFCSKTNCQSPKLENNSFIAFGEKEMYSVNDEIYIRCKEGYKIKTQPQIRRCLNTGLWDEYMPICQEATVPPEVIRPEPGVIAAVAACVAFVVAVILSVATFILWRKIQSKNRGHNSRTYFAKLQNMSKQGFGQEGCDDVPSNENTL